MPTITPSLWFDGVAAEAAEFYTGLFDDGKVTSTEYYPTDGLPEFQAQMAGKELTVSFTIGGLEVIAINAGPEFSFTPAASFMVNFDPSSDDDARAHLDELWAALSDGGSALMPLGEYPFSPHYGWITDRYGLSWQLILTDPDGDPRPKVMPALMFCGPAQNRCAEALTLYTSLFDDSRIGTDVRYDHPQGPVVAGSVMFSDLQLAGQWFVAMDSGGDQPFTFNEAFSLMVSADGQDEIDRYWAALSAVPESEQCGWCKDEFGLSWQVVPANLGELMSKPDSYQTMMSQKKFVIADF